MTEEVILREVIIEEDATKLAEMWKVSDEQWPGARAVWGLLWLAAALTLLIAFKNSLANGQAQGRFLFPSICALSMIIAGGWVSLLNRHARFLPYGTAAMLICLNLIMWFDGILPVYYASFSD